MTQPLYDWHCHGCGHTQTLPRHPAPRRCISGLCEGTSYRGTPKGPIAGTDQAPVDQAREALEIRLRLQAPLRSKTHAQVNELDTPLFYSAAAPSLF